MGELFGEVDGAGLFIASKFLGCIAEQFLGGDCAAGFEDDEGNGDLSPVHVCLSTDTDLCYGGMRLQDSFDFGRVDILSARDDEVGPAVEDIEVAFVIKVTDVARGEPAIL